MKKIVVVLLIVIGCMGIFLGCNDTSQNNAENLNVEPVVQEDAEENVVLEVEVEEESQAPKYVFLFIGDGNGLSQISIAENYLGHLKTGKAEAERFNFTQFPSQGIITTYSENSFITDSAAAGTAIATGSKTNSGVVGLDADGNELTSIAEIAQSLGMKVGLVSSATMTHATPAAFYANVESRRQYYDIGLDLIESDFDYFGGGMLEEVDNEPNDLYDLAKEAGYLIADTKEAFDALDHTSGKVITHAVTADGNVPYRIDSNESTLTLADFTRKGIEVLDNEDGFFMMVESGKIDWACHANDAVTSLNETIAMGLAIEEAIKFYNEHPDETLIVVTADHETGGMSLGFAGTHYENFYSVLSQQTRSAESLLGDLGGYFAEKKFDASLDDIMIMIEEAFGLKVEGEEDDIMVLTEKEYHEFELALIDTFERKKDRNAYKNTFIEYGYYDPLLITALHVLNQKAGISWTTYSHTGIPVPIYAIGNGSDLFDGYFDNVDVFYKLDTIIRGQ